SSGDIVIERIGADDSTVLMATFGAKPPAAAGAPKLTSQQRATAAAAHAPAGRAQPLRFVWQMDADSRFSLGSDEFSKAIGPRTATTLGRPWNEIAAALGLDADGKIARAIASRETFSGIALAWPVDDSDEPLGVELSGFPVIDQERAFGGYRGFGLCRDVA